MKTIQYKIAVLLIFFGASLIAQNHSRTYNEEFTTNNDVIIDVNTRNTDVKIETWNKNKVSIEAIIVVEGAEDERAKRTLDNWKFNAMGNKSEVEVSSSGGSSYLLSSHDIVVNGKFNEEYNYNYNFPEIELDDLIELNNDIMVLPEIPELPKMEDFHFDFHFDQKLPKFDYEKYKDDKSYLKKWQKEMEANLEKNKIKWEKGTKKAKEHKAVLKIELKKMAEEHKKHSEEGKKIIEKRLAQAKQANGKMTKRKEDADKKRKIIIGVLADREKIKVKRTITIKAPKNAKFKMDVKYGTLSFPN